MKNASSSKLDRFVEFCIRRRIAVVILYVLLTAIMMFFALRVEIKTAFDDLLPSNHAYVQIHERFKQDFGGSNVVSIMLEMEKGDIFNQPVLEKVKKITTQLQQVHGVNQFQIISLASKKLKEVRGSTDAIVMRPIMWPDVPRTTDEMQLLKESVLDNPLVYGAYVSLDLKSTLITVDFHEDKVDYKKIFPQIKAIADAARGNGVLVKVVGEPILFGWVNHYLPETLNIFLITIGALVALLFLVSRTWRGTFLPLLAGLTSAIWALGAASLLGYNLDPLVIVIAFLITARAISHSVQLVARFDDEMAAGASTTTQAASASMRQLFKPGILGVVADAGCMIVVALTPIPLMHKVSIIGTVWVMTIAISACMMTPVLLSFLTPPKGFAHPVDLSRPLDAVLSLSVYIATSRWRFGVLGAAALVFIASGLYAFKLKVGDAEPGSPILWQNSVYNQDSKAINKQFQGADRLYVVYAGQQSNAIKDPAVLESMGAMQRYMAAQPEIGGSLSIADVLPAVRKNLREGNPRYQQLGNNASENGELAYLLVGGSEPGDMARFTDVHAKNAPVTFFFRDHKGDSISTAMARLKHFIATHPVANGEYLLGGGLIAVLGAVNEIILAGQIESIALALLVLVVCCGVAYRSSVSGIFFMAPVVLSNTLTFSYMAWQGIGMNISTLPVAALGIGLGVDYAFYIVDGIREHLREQDDVGTAIIHSLRTAGRGVLITSLTLTISVVLWCASSLRFQSDMGVLMAIWLFISSFSALFVVPAMVYVFRPEFIVGKGKKSPSAVVESDVEVALVRQA